MAQSHILIIKHGALGDIILATGPMQAIRNQHPNAHITLLTTKPYDKLLATAPFVDDIWVDNKPKPWHLMRLYRLIKQLRHHRWDWVYDLQTSQRSTQYYHHLPSPKPQCSGLHPKASHPHHTPERTSLHTIDRQKQQLSIAGIGNVPPPNLDWLHGDCTAWVTASTQPFILMVPGGSAHRPEKRWPAEHYATAAQQLADKGYHIFLIGTGAEADILEQITTAHPNITNLCSQTSFAQLAQLARNAYHAIGNDTGPMHIIAAAGCPCSVLFNRSASNPDLCAPRGDHVTLHTVDNLHALTPDNVLSSIASENDAKHLTKAAE